MILIKTIEGDSNKKDILTYLSIKDIFLHLIKSNYYKTLNLEN